MPPKQGDVQSKQNAFDTQDPTHASSIQLLVQPWIFCSIALMIPTIPDLITPRLLVIHSVKIAPTPCVGLAPWPTGNGRSDSCDWYKSGGECGE
jgi:hypothetical protein